MTYQTEFSDYPVADMPAIPADFVDNSWHNDVCPSFVSNDLWMTIWVDYLDPAMRETAYEHRFRLTRGDDADLVIETNDWQTILTIIEEERRRNAAL